MNTYSPSVINVLYLLVSGGTRSTQTPRDQIQKTQERA
jgi:hypothetical protein